MHPWVNYDQILQKCFIGRLVASDSSLTVDDLFGKPLSPSKSPSVKSKRDIRYLENTGRLTQKDISNRSDDSSRNVNLNEEDSNSEKSETSPLESSKVARSSSDVAKELIDDLKSRVRLPPRFDWIQKLNSITIIFYTKAFSNPMIEIYPPATNHVIKISFTYDDTLFEVSVALFYCYQSL